VAVEDPSREAQTTPADITASVLASFKGTADARLGTLLPSLVRHLHAFATEVDLTQAEWEAAMALLRASGDLTDERRHEFILWSDVLGFSMLVDALAHRLPPGATESTVLGPFYAPGAPLREHGASIAEEDDGEPAWVHGRVLDTAGQPIPGAELDVWQNGGGGLYAVQDAEAPEAHLRGRFCSREDGSYAFLAVRPVPYTIPSDGPVGAMLRAAARSAWRPAHIHLIVRAPGHRTLATHIFDAASPYLDRDAVFAVKPSLLRAFEARSPDDPDRPAGVDRRWYAVENDIVLAREV
jgi:hydroxyquinol 1,2-dioxygenase